MLDGNLNIDEGADNNHKLFGTYRDRGRDGQRSKRDREWGGGIILKLSGT